MSFKARDDTTFGRFWADVFGLDVSSEGPGVTNVEPVGVAYPDSAALYIDVVTVPDPETVAYHAHPDLATTSPAHHAELVAHLRELGATSADIGRGDVPRTVLADPEGNVFCVLEPRAIYENTGPIAAVVVRCADPRAMARFWSQATDWTLHEATDEYARLRSAADVGTYLEFVRAADLTPVTSRLHFDLRPYPGDDQAAEVDRLRTLLLGRADHLIARSGCHRRRRWPGQCALGVSGRQGRQRVLRPDSGLTRSGIADRTAARAKRGAAVVNVQASIEKLAEDDVSKGMLDGPVIGLRAIRSTAGPRMT